MHSTRAMFCTIALAASFSAVGTANAAAVTPEQAYSVLHSAVRGVLGYPTDDLSTSNYWLSLTVVGAVVSSNDKAQVNDLANFCPPASPTLQSYARDPKLDAIYQRLLEGIAGPTHAPTPAYQAAMQTLSSGKYVKYVEYQKQQRAAFAEFLAATTQAQRQAARDKQSLIEQEWTIHGFRSEIDQAWDVINREEFLIGAQRQARRRRALDDYRSSGLGGSDYVGAFVSPASQLSPPPEEWDKADGWVKVTRTASDFNNKYSHTSASAQGYGGFNLGFVNIGGSAGGGKVTESRVNQANLESYSFSVKRVLVRRPWLDTDIFFEPKTWTWNAKEPGKDYPRVSVKREASGKPIESSSSEFRGQRISCSLLPQEFIIAKDIILKASTSKSDYEKIVSDISAGGHASFFGLFGGGGGGSVHQTKISESGSTVTFDLESTGISVIGVISQILPETPTPDPTMNWPANAWLPN